MNDGFMIQQPVCYGRVSAPVRPEQLIILLSLSSACLGKSPAYLLHLIAFEHVA